MFLTINPWLRTQHIHYFRYFRCTRFIPINCFTPNTRLRSLSSDCNVSRYQESLKHLQISEECSLEEARASYIKLAKLFHPDSRSSCADPKRFSETRNAYLTVLKNKQYKKGWDCLNEEDWNPEFIIDHIVPQHRQFLELEGVGTGNPSERHKYYQRQKFSEALDSVYEHRKNKSLKNEDETSVGFHDGNAKRKLEFQKRRSTQTLVQLADDLIRQAMTRGEFDNLKGTGQPLKHTTQNPYIDTHTKYLNEYLINSGYTLDWISQEKEIRESYALLRKEFIDLIREHKGNLSEGNSTLILFKERLGVINKTIDRFNLQVPVLSMQKFHYDFHRIYKQALVEYQDTSKLNVN